LVLAESQAILRYLAAREGRDDLYPADPAARARIDWALDSWTTAAFPRIMALYRALSVETLDDEGKPHPENADPAKVEQETPSSRDGFGLWEQFVADDGTVVGGGFTIADCSCGSFLLRVGDAWPFDLATEFPKVARIRDALQARPSASALP